MTTYCKNEDIVSLLLQNNVDVNAQNAMGLSALMISCLDVNNIACSQRLVQILT